MSCAKEPLATRDLCMKGAVVNLLALNDGAAALLAVYGAGTLRCGLNELVLAVFVR
jgi:hypothetical protein